MVSRHRPVTEAVTALLESLELDEMGRARAAVALSLAQRIDDTTSATTGAVAMAAAGLSRELQVTLEAILAPAQAESADAFLHRLISTETP
ncbi:MAG: hypothetical protein WB565_03785 [Acidimicrobiales bacterium]